jgi:hypothetical protein
LYPLSPIGELMVGFWVSGQELLLSGERNWLGLMRIRIRDFRIIDHFGSLQFGCKSLRNFRILLQWGWEMGGGVTWGERVSSNMQGLRFVEAWVLQSICF